MKGDYPQFQKSYTYEDLIEHFLLDETERESIAQFRGETNRHGIAILLKSMQHLGYFPQHINEIPGQIKAFIAKQLNLVVNLTIKWRDILGDMCHLPRLWINSCSPSVNYLCYIAI